MLLASKQANTLVDLSLSGQIPRVSYHCSACGGTIDGHCIFAMSEYFLLTPKDYMIEQGMLAILELESKESYAFVADVYNKLHKEELIIPPTLKFNKAKIRIFPNGKIFIGELGHIMETSVQQYKSEAFISDEAKAFIEGQI